MSTEIQSNELIDNMRVSVIKTTGNYIDDLQALSKVINVYVSAYVTYENIPDTAPNKKYQEEIMRKAENELDLYLAYINIYNVKMRNE
jgi:hypothetical protein